MPGEVSILAQLQQLRTTTTANGNGHHVGVSKQQALVKDLRYPFSQAFQRKLLALLLQQRTILPIYASILKPSHFSVTLYQDTAELILDLWERYGTVPTSETLSERVEQEISRRGSRLPKDYPSKWRTLVDDLVSLHVPDGKIIVAQLTEWIQEGALKEALVQCGALLDQAERTGERNFGQIRSLVMDALSVGLDTFSNTIRYFEDLERRMNRLMFDQDNNLGLRVPLVLPAIDKILDGGPSRGEMTVWAAPTSRGKSWALLWIAKAALYQGKKVAYITSEMGKHALATRMDRSVAQLNKDEIQRNPGLARRRIENLASLRGELFITECMGRDATVERVHAALEIHRADTGFSPDVIIVDYPGTMYSPRRHNERRHEMADIYREIRALGKEWDAVIHTAMQTNRGSLSRKVITIRDLAECFEVAWHSDIILALCQTSDEERENIMRIFVAKSRESRDHHAAPFYFNKDTGTFTTAGEAFATGDDSINRGLEQAQEHATNLGTTPA